jgi:hypothetical protein
MEANIALIQKELKFPIYSRSPNKVEMTTSTWYLWRVKTVRIVSFDSVESFFPQHFLDSAGFPFSR